MIIVIINIIVNNNNKINYIKYIIINLILNKMTSISSKKLSPKNQRDFESPTYLRAGAGAGLYEEPKSSRGNDIPEETKSRRGLKTSPTATSSRRQRKGTYTDVAAKSSRRYLIPARLPGFRNFLCNMLEYRGEMKDDMTFYPIGYISYLLRAYSYDTSSITPINMADDTNLKPLLNAKDSIELLPIDKSSDNAINFPDDVGYRARFVKETDKNILFPATIIYKPNEEKSCIYMKDDMTKMISAITQRFIVVFIREVVVDSNEITLDTYLPIFIDQKRKTIDIIPEFSDSNNLMKETRNDAIVDLIDTEGYKINVYNTQDKDSNPRIWQIMMVHLKLINQVGSFNDMATNFLAELEKQNKNLKSITYSYFMKIMRLSVNEKIDRDLLYIFHGSD
jgi:hypothetical protein